MIQIGQPTAGHDQEQRGVGEMPQEVLRTGLSDKAWLPVLASETYPGSGLALSLPLDDLEPVSSPLGASVSLSYRRTPHRAVTRITEKTDVNVFLVNPAGLDQHHGLALKHCSRAPSPWRWRLSPRMATKAAEDSVSAGRGVLPVPGNVVAQLPAPRDAEKELGAAGP